MQIGVAHAQSLQRLHRRQHVFAAGAGATAALAHVMDLFGQGQAGITQNDLGVWRAGGQEAEQLWVRGNFGHEGINLKIGPAIA